MFIHLTYQDVTKKLNFKAEYQNLPSLLCICESVTGWPKTHIKLKFKDVEGDDISIMTENDMEYFIEQDHDNKFKQVEIRYEGISNNDVSESKQRSRSFQERSNIDRDENGYELSASYNNILLDWNKGLELKNNVNGYQDGQEYSFTSRDMTQGNSPPYTPDVANKQMKLDQLSLSKIEGDNDPIVNTVETERVDFNSLFYCLKQLSTEFREFKNFVTYKIDDIETSHSKLTQHVISLASKVNEKLICNTDISRTSTFKAVHTGTKCQNCHESPIVGKRFKCLECSDHDICDKCERLGLHTHEMIRIVTPIDKSNLKDKLKVYSRRVTREAKAEKKPTKPPVNITKRLDHKPPIIGTPKKNDEKFVIPDFSKKNITSKRKVSSKKELSKVITEVDKKEKEGRKGSQQSSPKEVGVTAIGLKSSKSEVFHLKTGGDDNKFSNIM